MHYLKIETVFHQLDSLLQFETFGGGGTNCIKHEIKLTSRERSHRLYDGDASLHARHGRG